MLGIGGTSFISIHALSFLMMFVSRAVCRSRQSPLSSRAAELSGVNLVVDVCLFHKIHVMASFLSISEVPLLTPPHLTDCPYKNINLTR